MNLKQKKRGENGEAENKVWKKRAKKAKSLETERRKAEAEQKRKTKEIQRNKREE